MCVCVCVGHSQSLDTDGGSHGNHRRGLLQPTHLCLGTCPGTMAVWERDCSTKELFRDKLFFSIFFTIVILYRLQLMWEEVGQYGTDLDRIGSQDRMYFKLTCKNKLYIYYIIHTFYITHKETQKKIFRCLVCISITHTHTHTHTHIISLKRICTMH